MSVVRPPLIIRTLGPFETIRDGRLVRVERTKHKALLAYLSINRGRWCPRSVLADLLWETSSEENSRHSLNQALYSLRRLLPEFLLVQKESVRCDIDCVITDIDQVAELIKSGNVHEAIAAMRGTFLEDVDLRQSPEITGLRGLIFLAQGRISEAQKCNDAARGGAARLGYRSGDISSMEIPNSRMHHRRGATGLAIEQLVAVIADYRERDVMCRLRMELELARLLKSTDRAKARVQANNVFIEATRIGARPLAEAADELQLRL